MKTDRWQTSTVSGFSQLCRIIGGICLSLAVFAPGRADAQPPPAAEAEATEPPVLSEEPEPVPSEETTDPADAAALTHFHEARSLYDRGAYREALVQFRASYLLSRRAVLFYNYSLCYQRLQEYGDAVNYLERYLLEVVNVPNRANLELRLRRLRAAAGEETRGSEGSGSHTAAWVALGVGAAGALTALVAGPLALSERSRLDEQPCALSSTCDASTLRRRALITDLGIGVAAAGAALGVILWFVLQPDDDDDEAANLRFDPSLSVDQHGAGAQLVGHF